MSHIVEGIGDEITWIFIIILAFCIIYLAWKSTGISPTEYYVWLVRMRVNPNLNTFQVSHILHMADTDASVFEQRSVERERLNANVFTRRNSSEANEQLGTENDVSIRRRRSLSGHTSNVDNGHTAHLLLSRFPARIDESQDTGNQLLANTNESVLMNSSERTEPVEVPANTQRAHPSSLTDGNSLDYLERTDIPGANNSSLVEDNEKGSIRIKLKFLDDTQIVATTSLEATVGEFKRRYFYDPILAGKVVRLIFRGQLLRDDSRSLSSYGIHDECVLHCNVISVPYPQPSSNSNSRMFNSIQSSVISSRQTVQTYRGRSIEDSLADPYLLRLRNAIIRWFRASYNFIMGPFPRQVDNRRDEVAAAAAAASRGLGDSAEAVSIGMLFGQHLHIFFAVKFVLLWTFVYLYPQYTDRLSMIILSFLTGFFATIVFTSRRENRAETQIT